MAQDDAEDLKLGDQLCFAVHATAHRLNRAYKPLLGPLGLTYPQYLVLLVLWERDRQTVGEIGRQLYLDSGTLTPLLKRLEAGGYVHRTRSASDERQVRISLTEQANEIRTHVAAGRRELVDTLGRSEEQIQALRQELDQIRRTLGDQVRGAADTVPSEDGPTLATPAKGSEAELG